MHVAEQVSVGQPVRAVASALAPDSGLLRRLAPLAWTEGELVRRRDGGSPGEAVQHRVTIGAPVRDGDGVALSLSWSARPDGGAFSRFTGTVTVRPLGTGSVLAVVGEVDRDGHLPGTTRRPAEVVLRALLGHVRTALEASAPEPA